MYVNEKECKGGDRKCLGKYVFRVFFFCKENVIIYCEYLIDIREIF